MTSGPRQNASKSVRQMPAVTVATYRRDPLYPRVVRAVADILQHGKIVAPVDVLVRMDLLSTEQVEDWRRGRVPYLEQVVRCNLTKLSRLLRILRFHSHDLKLVPSVTVYRRWDKGPKRRLRFTKSGDPRLEEAYGRHFTWPGKSPFRSCVSDTGRVAADHESQRVSGPRRN